MAVGLLVLFVIVSIPIFWAVGATQRLSALRKNFRGAFERVDRQLKRRYDAIPALVEAAKVHMRHEVDTLDAVSAARNSAASARQAAAIDPGNGPALTQMSNAEATLRAALARFFALAEAFPDFKADAHVRRICDDLAAIEHKIAYSRQAFNDAVMRYNAACRQFPARTLAGAFGFKPAGALLSIEPAEERKAPAVAFG